MEKSKGKYKLRSVSVNGNKTQQQELIDQYCNGEISPDEFINGIEKSFSPKVTDEEIEQQFRSILSHALLPTDAADLIDKETFNLMVNECCKYAETLTGFTACQSAKDAEMTYKIGDIDESVTLYGEAEMIEFAMFAMNELDDYHIQQPMYEEPTLEQLLTIFKTRNK